MTGMGRSSQTSDPPPGTGPDGGQIEDAGKIRSRAGKVSGFSRRPGSGPRFGRKAAVLPPQRPLYSDSMRR
jgi:hypothetical protein